MREPTFKFRLYLLTACILLGMGVLLSKLHEFQIERSDEFEALVPGNRTVSVREPGIRGEITDRNQIPLARNLRNYVISFNLDEIAKAYRADFKERLLNAPITEKEEIEATQRKTKIVDIVNEFTIKPLQELGLAKNYSASALQVHHLTHGGLIPFTYRSDLSYEDFARLAERNLDFPGVTLEIRPRRQYPYGTLASHVLGYLKQWEKGDISPADRRTYDHFIGEEKGIAGIEATMDEYLRGPEGRKTVLKNEKGRDIGILDITKPAIGAQVELTIDARIQYLLENTLRRAGRAAGVVMDVRTGEILAIASVPDYDPNAFIPSISAKRFREYNSNRLLSPFTNRAITSFTPGSTMKIPTALAGARKGMALRNISCGGYVPYGKHRIGCWLYNQNGGSHGSISLSTALQKSCNPYFNKLANDMGSKAMVEGFSLLGFGKKTGVELPNEDPGILPGSRDWRAAKPRAVMTPALTAMLSIGQGDTMATPLQMATMVSAIANDGKLYRPRIVKKIISGNGRVLVPDSPELKTDLLRAGVKISDLEIIRDGMYKAVNVAGGTAGKVKMTTVKIAGKSGTAQTVEDGKSSNNSWIASFAPYENPRYAVVIMAQAAGSGGGVCGPLTNMVYTGIFAQEDGMRLPLKPQVEYKGHLEFIKAIKPLDDVIAAIEASEIPAGEINAVDDSEVVIIGETGNEVNSELTGPLLVKPKPTLIPQPTITEEVDSDGIIVPRALPVFE